MRRIIETDFKSKKEWIEMFPYGLAMGASGTRPVMIFKDKNEEKVLPVWLSPLDSAIAVSQSGGSITDSSPHNLTQKMLEALEVKVEKCYFTELKGHHQFLRLEFSGSDKLKELESRADEAISFCLSVNSRFFCRRDFIDKCRVMDSELDMPNEVDMTVTMENERPYLN